MTDRRRLFLVTGASNGIGKASANLLNSLGEGVIACDIQPCESKDFIYLDLNDLNSIQEASNNIPDGIAGIINCAGIAPKGNNHRAILKINWLGTKVFTALNLKRLTDDGSVTTVASRAGANWGENLSESLPLLHSPSYNESLEIIKESSVTSPRAYELSKELLILWSMDQASKQTGIRFNTVSPSSVETRLTPQFREAFSKRVQDNQAIRLHQTQPQEIAQAIWFLANPSNKSINGIDLKIDQGITAVREIKNIHTNTTGCKE